MFEENAIRDLRNLLTVSHNIVLTTHARPDGDAVGSSLGLLHYLESLGKKVTAITPDEVAGYLHFLDGVDKILDATEKPEAARAALKNADLIFCLDYSALNRVDDLAGPLQEAGAPKVLVDHHLDPEDHFQYVFHTHEASSTAELVWLILEGLGAAGSISKNAAEALYTGLVTDTGSFRHSNTTARVHKIASALLELGVEVEKVGRHVFDAWSERRLKFLGYCLSEKMVVIPEYKAAYITISQEDIKRFDLQTGDTEGLVNYTLAIEGNIFGVMITDRGDKRKLSFRSKGEFPARWFAQQFNGGGHLNAAGGRSEVSLEDTVKKLRGLMDEWAEGKGFEGW